MFRRASITFIASGTFCLAAEAQQLDAASASYVLYTAQDVLLILGMAFAGYWAYQAFDSPPITLGEGPTLPRYMTQPNQYRLGVGAYVTICLLVYALIAYFHKDLFPLLGSLVSSELSKTIEKWTTDGSLPYPLIVIFSAAIFIGLLKIEKDWNPLYLLRRVVHGWVSIPQFANKLMVMTRDILAVPPARRASVAADHDAPHVAIGDFDKDQHSMDRQWAELCYIRLWLSHARDQGSHFSFFNEPSFAWNKVQADYQDVRKLITPIKLGQVTDQAIFEDVAGRVDVLRRRYCRLIACFLVFKNQTKKNALKEAKDFGVNIAPDVLRANPLRYAVIFVAAIIIAVYLGVSLTSVGWDLLQHADISAALSQDPEVFARWTYYGLASYGMPILAVLLLRYIGWTGDAGQPNSYLTSYATIFLLALCVSAVSLAGAVKLAGTAPAADQPLAHLFVARIKWGISPAIVAVYVAYHVDKQIDPMLPDNGSGGSWRFPQRLISCLFFALLVAGFSASPTLSITQSRSSWPTDKLRIVILGTTLIIGLTMALVGEFWLIKPKPTPE